MEIICVEGKNMPMYSKCINPIPVDTTYMGNYLQNFRFVTQSDFLASDDIFIIAQVGKDIVGMLKFKRYAQSDHRYVPEHERAKLQTYLCIRYIDVREDCKHQGIAKCMISSFANLVATTYPTKQVRLSPLSQEGKAANLDKLFKLALPSNVKVSKMR